MESLKIYFYFICRYILSGTQPASGQSGNTEGTEPADTQTDGAGDGVVPTPSGEGGDDKPVPERKPRTPADPEVLKSAWSLKDRVLDDIPLCLSQKCFRHQQTDMGSKTNMRGPNVFGSALLSQGWVA